MLRRRRRQRLEEEPPSFEAQREHLISTRPEDIGLSPSPRLSRVWAAMMEVGVETGVSSVICVADGTTSLYSSFGPGIVGGGTHGPVIAANERFLAQADRLVDRMQPVDELPLPARREVRFHALTYWGPRTASAPGLELAAGGGAFFPLFVEGREVLRQLRLFEAQRARR